MRSRADCPHSGERYSATSPHVRQVLRQLPQPTHEDRRPRARCAGPDADRRTRRSVGKGRAQASHGRDASGRTSATGQGDLRTGRDVARGGPRSRRRRPPEPGPAHTPSSQSRRVPQRHPRPARARDRSRRPAARRQRSLWVRQQRRRVVVVALLDGAIPGSGSEDQPDGAGTRSWICRAGDRRCADRSQPGQSLQRRTTVGFARWRGVPLLLSRRRRVPVRAAVEGERR